MYLNEHSRGIDHGIEFGADPKRPVLKVRSNMHDVVTDGHQDKLESVEVGYCCLLVPALYVSLFIGDLTDLGLRGIGSETGSASTCPLGESPSGKNAENHQTDQMARQHGQVPD